MVTWLCFILFIKTNMAEASKNNPTPQTTEQGKWDTLKMSLATEKDPIRAIELFYEAEKAKILACSVNDCKTLKDDIRTILLADIQQKIVQNSANAPKSELSKSNTIDQTFENPGKLMVNGAFALYDSDIKTLIALDTTQEQVTDFLWNTVTKLLENRITNKQPPLDTNEITALSKIFPSIGAEKIANIIKLQYITSGACNINDIQIDGKGVYFTQCQTVGKG